MESNSTPLPKSRVRLFPLYSKNPSQTPKSPATHFLLFITIFILSFSTTTTSQTPSPNPQIPYSKHCNHIVPEPQFSAAATISAETLRLRNGYFSGGDPIFGPKQQSDDAVYQKSLSFIPQSLHMTDSKGVYKVQAFLNIRAPGLNSLPGNSTKRRLRLVRFRGPKIPVRRGSLRFWLNGFWSESSGKLCMLGSSSGFANSGNSRSLGVVLKLNYPANSSIVNSLVSGSLESVDSVNYFEPISILSVNRNLNYKYTLVEKEIGTGCSSENDDDGKENLSLIEKLNEGVCSTLSPYYNRFELEYGSDFLGGGIGYRPNFMYIKRIRCSDKRKLQMLLGFPNSSFNGFRFPFDPNTTLIAEGAWDEKKNRLCAVACRILNFTETLGNAFVGDCSIKLSLRFPAVLLLRNRSSAVGQIWSNKTVNDSGYFGKIGFRASPQESLLGLPGVKYEYTEIDNVRKSCAKMEAVKHNGNSYPNGHSVDMTFHMLVRNSEGQIAEGYSYPLFVGDKFYAHGQRYFGPVEVQTGATIPVDNNHGSLLNVSYNMRFTPPPDFKFGSENSSAKLGEISAEGTYNMETGILCMIGCRHLGLNQKLAGNDSLDCEIVVNVQFPPLNAKSSDHLKGTIDSTRKKSNPLYFERLEFSSNSISTSQAKASIWRMDLEITMVLISNTLACVFVGLQLFYVKKHPDVLPLISILMLAVLTLGHMIPLVLNFEALFAANHNRQNVFLESGGWLEVNEVIVRVVTMIAFLLQFRLLQLTWSARQGDGSQKSLWVSEKKVLFVSLPLYIGGGLIAWFVHQWKISNQSSFLRPHRMGYQLYQPLSYHQQHSLWGNLKSYAGLVQDGFLLPQIIFNLFINSREKAVASSFYIGTTIVRLLPHAYDLCRAHGSTWDLDLSYIYANHRMDFYSTAWDIIIPCGGLLFAVLIYLQQRFGGRCILPKRFRESCVYQKVSTVSSEELKEYTVP